MTTALNVALQSPSSSSSSSSASSSSFNPNDVKRIDYLTSSSPAVHSDTECARCSTPTADTGSGNEFAARTSPPPVEAPSNTDVVDELMPSCGDVIGQYCETPMLTTSKFTPIDEAEVGRPISMVAFTSSANTTMPTGLSMPFHQRSSTNGQTSPTQGQQQNTSRSTEMSGTSTIETRFPVGGTVTSSATAGEMSIVYLLASPGIRPGLNVSVHSSGVVPPSVGGATFAVVSQANSSANGDVRPVLRFMQISKPPTGGVLSGPVASLAAGLHLVGARPTTAARLTPVYGPLIGQSVMRPSMLSSQASAVVLPMTSGLPTHLPVNNHVVHHGGSPAGVVRLATLPPHHQLNPSSTTAVFLVASGANSAVNPRPSGVNGHFLTSSSTLPGARSSSSLIVVSSSLPASFTSLVASSSATAALSSSAETTTVSGSRHNAHEKNAYEYERVMDILRYYRELVVDRKLPGACLPCKRRKSKPLVSAGPGTTASINDDDSSPLPIPPPPPPTVPPTAYASSVPSTGTGLSQQPCSVIGGMLVPGMPGIRIPLVRGLTTTPPGSFGNGIRPFGLPLNVAAIIPPRFVVTSSPHVASTSSGTVLAPHQLPPEGAVRRLLFYAAPSSSTSVCSPPLTFVSTTSVSGNSEQTIETTSSAFCNDDLVMPFLQSRSGESMTSPLRDSGTVLQDVNWKSDWSKLSSLGSLTCSAFEVEPPVGMSRPKSADIGVPNVDELLPPSCRPRSRSLSGIESRSKCVSGPMPTAISESAADHRAEATHTNNPFMFPPLLMTSPGRDNDRFTSCGEYAYQSPPSDDRHAADNGCSPSLVMWPTTASHPVGLDPSSTGNECNGDAFVAARMARKRHMIDDDDSTWPEMENSEDGGMSGPAPHDFLNELEATYPETRQPIAAVKETGCTLTTVTFVTKWTSSRLAVVGPYQSWN